MIALQDTYHSLEPNCNVFYLFIVLAALEQPHILMKQTVNGDGFVSVYKIFAVWYNTLSIKCVMEHY